MRQILYRGKKIDNDVWTYGFYFERLINGEKHSYIKPLDEGFVVDEVIPETVGQFTGLTDKNGKKIFEGDIISATALDTGKEQRAVIGFGNFIDENNNDEYIGFFIEFDGIKTTITQLSMEECKNRIEVIGNKYDNKEEE